MSTHVTELFAKASALSDKDRATLAGLLIESLESETDPDVEEAWRVEIERRLAELDSGAVETVPWEVVRAKLLRRTE
ncbi:MAG TPA: addiction module protein [Pyrinomonadaceae bacterium]|jgi:putative addiction module component (TIGR02574 family)|nr:addiction module protein [Pyrinomonadaceae bacterium]